MVSKPILIVKDEPIVCESIRDWLKDAGYQVETAETGEEALEMIEKQDFTVRLNIIQKWGLRMPPAALARSNHLMILR